MKPQLTHFPTSRRTAYQFPIYRWMGWLAVGGFAIGLTAMFFISGMFGVPAPLGWATLVILFSLGALLLDRPKLLLNCMLIYFLMMPGNRLFGILALPLPSFLDELFFIPFIAVIVMNWIQRRQVQGGGWFPLIFGLIATLSWFVNGRLSPFTFVRATLIMLKPFIIWYYCRLTATFESEAPIRRWLWFAFIFAAIQFPYNCIWQGAPWPKIHADYSGGMFGPGAGGHLIGYLSMYALILMAGWWVGEGHHSRRRIKGWALFLLLVISYDLIFMTDTKHALVIAPFALIPSMYHPRVSMRLKTILGISGLLFMVTAVFYLWLFMGSLNLRPHLDRMLNSPKGDVMAAVTVDFKHLVPYPFLGAGPGRFGSSLSVDDATPLARRYILPIMDERRRYFMSAGATGFRTGGSQLVWPQSDFFTLMGEYGWAGTLVYFSFWGWVVLQLLRKSYQVSSNTLLFGTQLALSCCLMFLAMLMMFVTPVTMPVLSFTIWAFVGRVWDMKPTARPEAGAETLLPEGA